MHRPWYIIWNVTLLLHNLLSFLPWKVYYNYEFITLSKLQFLLITFLRIIWNQLLWAFFTRKGSTLYVKYFMWSDFLISLCLWVTCLKIKIFWELFLSIRNFNEEIHCDQIILISTYLIIIFFEIQRQPPGVFYKRSCS